LPKNVPDDNQEYLQGFSKKVQVMKAKLICVDNDVS
jgi:hypothetical protein